MTVNTDYPNDAQTISLDSGHIKTFWLIDWFHLMPFKLNFYGVFPMSESLNVILLSYFMQFSKVATLKIVTRAKKLFMLEVKWSCNPCFIVMSGQKVLNQTTPMPLWRWLFFCHCVLLCSALRPSLHSALCLAFIRQCTSVCVTGT